MASVQSIIPPPHQGVFWMAQATAFTSSYPDTGRDDITPTASAAHWKDLGLAVGSFEVVVDSITTEAATTRVTLVALHADGESYTCVTGTAHSLNIPFRDGFVATSTTSGCAITYRIHIYQS